MSIERIFVAVKETKLEQNVPNPFRTRTRFDYTIGKAGFVELVIHSNDGKSIAALVNELQEEGSYTAHWNTNEVAPGVYFYTLRVDGVDWVKKAVKIR